ncbi:hypothetical protein O6H91_12G076300 [Diphasiastrum complanatum]|uniref:Uncharacterized protein n=4 Tax=Diphasiastrum complanatum TaxID=34168 RepID=A0ACC2C3M3_DIPCM|nr:hypothetical protein O6H91_12G076300 [Diphasiastrum complanatum]KAJ7536653.1 hypothetical protein O6H91_12G076300 [Diphasiastrum complanatum]KAJ7536654.1 hypothetical protein O6H91_12G076300 [Diphasiastrum complanatum]KAJ7536655.1 hypothetical protein O6H91_12G076300 [Diphasiastrum complanatum]
MGGRRPFNIADCTRKLDVDNRLSLKLYYRAADVLLKQASIYRDERNTLELYIILVRFSSLVTETIPQHRDYRSTGARERSFYRTKLSDVLAELEILKPNIQRQVEQINNDCISSSASKWSTSDLEWPGFEKSQFSKYDCFAKGNTETTFDNSYGGFPGRANPGPSFDQVEEQFHTSSFSLPLPNDETLLRHSYLGLSQQSQRHANDLSHKIYYPSGIDSSPVTIPSLDQSWHTIPSTSGVASAAISEPFLRSESNSVFRTEVDAGRILSPKAPSPVSQFDLLNQLLPPPVALPVKELPTSQLHPSDVADPWPGPARISENELSQRKGPKKLHIAYRMMEAFMDLAKANTKKNIETCGVLAGSLKKGTFYVTSLIVPKQEATSDSCQTVNEEEIFDAQDKRGLFQLGWIHTHPSQTCFMSSIDLHTHYSYQVMLPEAIAIVMAPTDASRTFGIFRLSDPGGVRVIQQCEKRGFHPHESPAEGGPIYEHCSHVSMDPNVKFEIIDLR